MTRNHAVPQVEVSSAALDAGWAETVVEKFADLAEAEQTAVMYRDAAVTCASVTKQQNMISPPRSGRKAAGSDTRRSRLSTTHRASTKRSC